MYYDGRDYPSNWDDETKSGEKRKMKEVHIFCDLCGTELSIDAGHYIGTELKMNGVDHTPLKLDFLGNAPSTIGPIKIEKDLCPTCSKKVRSYMESITDEKG